MSWAESVDRVLHMRAVAKLEAEKAELIRIIQETERRCKVVVNRQVSEVLKDVPSWKDPEIGGVTLAEKPRHFRPGMRSWAERRARLEKKHRVEKDKRDRRAKEFEQVLSGEFGTRQDVAGILREPAQLPVRSRFHAGQGPATEESSDVEPESD